MATPFLRLLWLVRTNHPMGMAAMVSVSDFYVSSQIFH